MSIYSEASKFNKAFLLGKLFDDVNLSENSPCNTCEDMKAYRHYCLDDQPEYHICLDRDYAEEKYLHNCKLCIGKLNYDRFCMAKLAEYEKKNISTKQHKSNLSLTYQKGTNYEISLLRKTM